VRRASVFPYRAYYRHSRTHIHTHTHTPSCVEHMRIYIYQYTLSLALCFSLFLSLSLSCVELVWYRLQALRYSLIKQPNSFLIKKIKTRNSSNIDIGWLWSVQSPNYRIYLRKSPRCAVLICNRAWKYRDPTFNSHPMAPKKDPEHNVEVVKIPERSGLCKTNLQKQGSIAEETPFFGSPTVRSQPITPSCINPKYCIYTCLYIYVISV